MFVIQLLIVLLIVFQSHVACGFAVHSRAMAPQHVSSLANLFGVFSNHEQNRGITSSPLLATQARRQKEQHLKRNGFSMFMSRDHHNRQHHASGIWPSNSTTLSATAVTPQELSSVRRRKRRMLGNLRWPSDSKVLSKNDYATLLLDCSNDHAIHHEIPDSTSKHTKAMSSPWRRSYTDYSVDATWESSKEIRDSTTEPISSMEERLLKTINNDLVLPHVSSTMKQPKLSQEQMDRTIMMARLFLIGAAALYGTNFSLVKLLGQDSGLPVGVSSTLRFGLAALATSPWLFAPSKTYSEDIPVQDEDDTNLTTVLPFATSNAFKSFAGGVEVGLWASIGYIAQAVGLETTPASESAFLCSLAVVVVPFMDFLAGRQLKGREWIGALMAMMGVGLLEFGTSPSDWATTPSWTYGDWASLLQPFAFGIGFWRMERIMHDFPNEASRVTAAQLLAVAVGSAIYSVVTEGGTGAWDWNQLQTWLSDPSVLAMIAWTGMASTALSVYMETRALQTLSAAETTLLLSTEPLWGAGFASVLIGEQFGMDSVAGGALILAGCLYSSLGFEGLLKSSTIPANLLPTQRRVLLKKKGWLPSLPWFRP